MCLSMNQSVWPEGEMAAPIGQAWVRGSVVLGL